MSDFSKQYSNFLAPEAYIKIDGKKLSSEHLYFTSLEVDKTIDGADTFSFSISDSISAEFEPNPTHKKLFELGNKIEIYMGYANSKGTSGIPQIFVGLITNVGWNFTEDKYLDITIEGYDYSFLLMKHTYDKKPFKEMTISGIVEDLLKNVYANSFTKENISDTKVTYPLIKNDKESDYAFIHSLAQRVGYEFYIDKESFHFRPAKKESSIFTLFYGQEILSFKPALNIEKEISEVRVVGLEFSADKKPIEGIAELKRPDKDVSTEAGIKALLRELNAVKYEVHEDVKTNEEAENRAKALLHDFSKNLFKAEIKSIGIPEIKPGITITLKGLGKRFSKDYYVEKVLHSFSDQGYETTISVRGSKSSFSLQG